jgi:hypothetical protein
MRALASQPRTFAAASLAAGLLTLVATSAQATFVALPVVPESSITEAEKLFLTPGDGNTLMGTVGCNSGCGIFTNDVTIGVTASDGGKATAASGWSTITPDGKKATLTEITFTPDNSLGLDFTSFSFRGNMGPDGGLVSVEVISNDGDQTFSFGPYKKKADITRGGIAAILGSGEFIDEVIITAANGFDEGKQYAFGDGTVTVPEPSTWAMMLVGFAGLGYAGYRKTKTSAALSI